MTARELLLGLDIGGTKTAALLVDRELRALGQATQATIKSSPADLVASVRETAGLALVEAGAAVDQVAAVGLAVPGLVDPETGVARLAVNLNLKDYPLARELARAFGAPTALENDVRTAALGAYRLAGDLEEVRHLVYLSIGTGIAAGLILDGRLYRGANGMAGEIGHLIFEPGGHRCSCGMPGCLEAVAAGPAVERLGRERLAGVWTGGEITTEAVYAAAARGEKAAGEIIRRVSRHLARAIYLLIMAYDVEKVVLGGGVTQSRAAFLDPVLEQMSLLRAESPLARTMLRAEKVTLLPAGYNAGAWGAVRLAKEIETGDVTRP
jgi:glucokinase